MTLAICVNGRDAREMNPKRYPVVLGGGVYMRDSS